MVIPEPTQSQEILYRHVCKVQLCNITHARLKEARNNVLESLAEDVAIKNLDAVLNTEDIQKRNRGIRSGNPGTSTNYPHWI